MQQPKELHKSVPFKLTARYGHNQRTAKDTDFREYHNQKDCKKMIVREYHNQKKCQGYQNQNDYEGLPQLKGIPGDYEPAISLTIVLSGIITIKTTARERSN